MREAIIYILQNCQTAFEELKRLNSELLAMLNAASITPEVNRIGDLHRMTQDYLIVRVAGLFDKDSRVASFANLCPQDQDYLNLKKELIILYLIDQRNNFTAHANLDRLQNGQHPESYKTLQSNLYEVLQKLLQLADKY